MDERMRLLLLTLTSAVLLCGCARSPSTQGPPTAPTPATTSTVVEGDTQPRQLQLDRPDVVSAPDLVEHLLALIEATHADSGPTEPDIERIFGVQLRNNDGPTRRRLARFRTDSWLSSISIGRHHPDEPLNFDWWAIGSDGKGTLEEFPKATARCTFSIEPMARALTRKGFELHRQDGVRDAPDLWMFFRKPTSVHLYYYPDAKGMRCAKSMTLTVVVP